MEQYSTIKGECNIDAHNNIAESQRSYAQWKGPDQNKPILYDNIYVKECILVNVFV